MFDFFKKKSPPNAMDAVIRATYGERPPARSANLQLAIDQAYEFLLDRIVPISLIKTQASALLEGPMPYSTEDLALSTALFFYKKPELKNQLFNCQIPARTKSLEWFNENKTNAILAKIFEDTLYNQYKSY